MLNKKTHTAIIVSFTILGGMFYYFLNLTHERCINHEINLYAKEKTFSMQDLNIGCQWDSILIQAPYSVINDPALKIYRNDRMALKENAKHASICTILFIHDCRVVAYAAIARQILDLVPITGTRFHKSETFSIDKNMVYRMR